MALTRNTITYPSNFTMLVTVLSLWSILSLYNKDHQNIKCKFYCISFCNKKVPTMQILPRAHYLPPLRFFTIPSSLSISLFFLIPTFCFCFSSSPLLLCTSVLSSVPICYFLSVGSMWTQGQRSHLAMPENVKQCWLWKPATTWEGMEGGFKPTRKACPIKVSLTACNYNFSYTYTEALETVQAFLFPTLPCTLANR